MFAYFGAKHRVVKDIWEEFGDPQFYVEPFGGTLATLLWRPTSKHKRPIETVGDAYGLLVNFWRSMRYDPKKLAWWAAGPVANLELQSRHQWLTDQEDIVVEKLQADPLWFDSQLGGMWLYGQQLIASGDWCNPNWPNLTPTIYAQHMWTGYRCYTESELLLWFEWMQWRLEHTLIVCGDWQSTIHLGQARRKNHSPNALIAILYDPPYSRRNSPSGRRNNLYVVDSPSVAAECLKDAIARAALPKHRIAFCCGLNEHSLPGWRPLEWRSLGSHRPGLNETIWFSSGCVGTTEYLESFLTGG